MAVNTLVRLASNDGNDPIKINNNVFNSISRLGAYIKRLATVRNANPTIIDIRSEAVAATGTLTISSGSGTVGGIINGVTVTVTWATSDTATATALATAINTSVTPLVVNTVSATAAAGVVTVISTMPGTVGNVMTLAATGTGVTASAARLAGGTENVTTASL